MRIAIAVVSHEGCTFNPTPTDLTSFEARCLVYGQGMLDNPPDAAGHLRGVVETLRRLEPDVELIPTVAARTTAGGRIERATLEHLRTTILDGLRGAGELDGFVFCLHGAGAAEGVDDIEGYLLKSAREVVGPDLPIGVTLDHHANITQKMIDQATVIVGDRYQPHDKHDTGRLLAELFMRVVRREVDPVMVYRKLPLISHQEQYLTSKPPMKTWFDAARGLESDGSVLSASTFPMQPWLDVEEAGYSVVVVTDGDRVAAGEAAEEIADLGWSLRVDFQRTDSVSPDEAVAIAAAQEGLSVMSDTGDSVGGGSGGDSTVLLEAFLRHGGPRALIPLVQPSIAGIVADLEEGQELTLEVGSEVSRWWNPVQVTGVVRRIEPDYVVPEGGTVQHVTSGHALPVQDARSCGATVVLEVDNVLLAISERPGNAGRAPVHFTGLGIDVDDYDAAVLKTASNFQFWSADLTTNVVRANTSGPTQSDMVALHWDRIPRPMYPLDVDLSDWKAR
ncbi:MAG: M81 family metallopeptidase [Acidimicrobiia bacterium]